MADTNDMKDEMQMKGRHPRRMAGAAFLMGLGAGMMATKMQHETKTPFQKFMDQFGM